MMINVFLNPVVSLSMSLASTNSRNTDTTSSSINSSSSLSSSNSKITVDAIAYSQQTPHSGRHFLPFHPYYYKGRHQQLEYPSSSLILNKHKRQALYFFIKNRILLPFQPKKASQSIKTKRFMEGWYLRLTLPQNNTSIAFMYSIEIEKQRKKRNKNRELSHDHDGAPSLTAVQIMGPNDTYLVQADTNITKFWAYENCQAFGCIFDPNDDTCNDQHRNDNNTLSSLPAIDTDLFLSQICSGYQVLPTKMQGRVYGHDGSFGGVMEDQGIYGSCEFDMDILPLSGWGDDDDHVVDDDHDHDEKLRIDTPKRLRWLHRFQFMSRKRKWRQSKQQKSSNRQRLSKNQKSTAGWLAKYSVFEPHWQITLADARATGYVNWNGTKYDFTNAPFYVEKNWGSSFPTKWYWIQCNSFHGFDDENNHSRLSLTAGGGVRKLSFFGLKKTENLGLVGIHYNGTFYENVPWTGDMEWDIDTWGRWNFKGRCTSGKRLFEVIVNASCDLDAGVMLRVPTEECGLEYMCRDTFEGRVQLSLYELTYCKQRKDYVRRDDIPPILKDAISDNCAVEVGGPWHEPWKADSKMNKLMKSLVRIPYLIS